MLNARVTTTASVLVSITVSDSSVPVRRGTSAAWRVGPHRSKRSIRRAVLVDELPLPIDHRCLEVVVWIAAFIARGPVAHFEVEDLFPGLVDQTVPVAGACPEAGTHPR